MSELIAITVSRLLVLLSCTVLPYMKSIRRLIYIPYRPTLERPLPYEMVCPSFLPWLHTYIDADDTNFPRPWFTVCFIVRSHGLS